MRAAEAIFKIIGKDRSRLIGDPAVTVHAVRLLELLPSNPVVTLPLSLELLGVSKPTVLHAINVLERLGVLHETTGKRRDRVFAYRKYLDVLTGE